MLTSKVVSFKEIYFLISLLDFRPSDNQIILELIHREMVNAGKVAIF